MTEPVRAQQKDVILRVSNSTDLHKLATSIQRHVEEGTRVVVSCVGVHTVNQAVKSIAVANGKTAPHGYLLFIMPAFHVEVQDNGVEHTVLRFVVIKHLVGT